MKDVLRQFYERSWFQRTRSGTIAASKPILTNSSGYVDPTFYDLSAFTGSAQFVDNVFTLIDNLSATKKMQFQLSGITAGQTRTLTAPDYDGTIATLAGTETFTNKTLTTPTIGSFVNANHTHADAAGGGQIFLRSTIDVDMTVPSGTYLIAPDLEIASGVTLTLDGLLVLVG